jgi:hypothetical protein
MAMNRQTATYHGLSVLMYGKPAAGVLGQILGHIAFYCHQNGLPTLNSLVVGKGRGTPGSDIPLDPADFDAERERVYALNWYDVYPPTKAELADAFAAAQNSS